MSEETAMDISDRIVDGDDDVYIEQISYLDREREEGRHALIPECCIEYFVNTWLPSTNDHTFNAKIYPAYKKLTRPIEDALRYHDNRFPIQYVMCPECIKTSHVVAIHMCKAKCQYKSPRETR